MEATNNTKTFRFKFSPDFMEELSVFARVHKHDDTKTFKTYWTQWIEKNNGIVNKEINELTEKGYQGNAIDKMYKSARYYYKNKSDKEVEPKKRRKYVSLSREVISSIDEHIERNINKDDYSPATGFDVFFENIDSDIQDLINITKERNEISNDDMKIKIKKTYKNRYFIKTH